VSSRYDDDDGPDQQLESGFWHADDRGAGFDSLDPLLILSQDPSLPRYLQWWEDPIGRQRTASIV
jgi:hypothetical protein